MGARIDAVTSLTGHGPRRSSARKLADAAMRACLTQAGKTPDDVDMLINTGVYREDSMGEPALAALIQEDIGASTGHRQPGGPGTFSFDLINGPCGVLAAAQVEAGLLRSGLIKLGAIVTSDVDPGPARQRTVPLRPSAGAMLLTWDDSVPGFTDFSTRTYPEYEDLFTSGLVWRRQRRRAAAPGAQAGQNKMVIEEKPGYRARLVDCADDAARGFLRDLRIRPADIALLAAAPAAPDFLDPLASRLGVSGDRIAYLPEDLGGGYTAELIAALHTAVRSGRLAEAGNTLLVAAGPGITVALSLYRQKLA
jgi:3-oxoacyl-[acyl-carrier-protein] synthase-3